MKYKSVRVNCNLINKTLLIIVLVAINNFVSAQNSMLENVDNFEYVHSILSKAKFHDSKSEFETNEQYEERVSSIPNIKIGTKKLTDIFIFKWTNSNSLTYDAETQIMKFKLTDENAISEKCSQPSLISGDFKIGEGVTKEGQTALGITKKFTSTKSFLDDLVIQNTAQLTDYLSLNGEFVIDFKVPLTTAKEIKENAVILYEVNLVKPYFYQKISISEPTILSPYESILTNRKLYTNVNKILIIDGRNGKELAKYIVKSKIDKIDIKDFEKEISETKNVIKKVFPELVKNDIYQKRTDEKNDDYFLRIRSFYKDTEFTLTKTLNNSHYDEYDKTLIIGEYKLFEKDNISLETRIKSCISISREMYEKIKDDLAIKVVGFPLRVDKKQTSFFVKKIFVFNKNTGEVYN